MNDKEYQENTFYGALCLYRLAKVILLFFVLFTFV